MEDQKPNKALLDQSIQAAMRETASSNQQSNQSASVMKDYTEAKATDFAVFVKSEPMDELERNGTGTFVEQDFDSEFALYFVSSRERP